MTRSLRRKLTIALHWMQLLLLLLMMSDGGRFPLLLWSYVGSAAAFCGLGFWKGLMTPPGPKLSGAARALHPWSHRIMYVLTAAAALVVALDALGSPLPWPGQSMALMMLFSAVSLHAIFHLWRHTTLMDGALRIITPRALHRIL